MLKRMNNASDCNLFKYWLCLTFFTLFCFYTFDDFHICLFIFIVVVDPKMIRPVTQKPWHDPNREFSDPLHPYCCWWWWRRVSRGSDKNLRFFFWRRQWQVGEKGGGLWGEQQQQWLVQFPWLRYEGQAMVCLYCRTCGRSVAGRTHFVNGSTQFKVQSLKLHNESQKHKTCRDRCITWSSQPLPTSFNRIDESNRSAENVEMIIKFNTAYNITKEELPFTKINKWCYLIRGPSQQVGTLLFL